MAGRLVFGKAGGGFGGFDVSFIFVISFIFVVSFISHVSGVTAGARQVRGGDVAVGTDGGNAASAARRRA
jgi:hypothetical protein